MRRSSLWALALGAGTTSALALGACGPQTVPLEVRFPSTETFLVSQSVRIRAYEVDADTTCATIVTAVANGIAPGATPAYEMAGITPCALRAGISIPDVGGGLHAFLVEGLDLTGNNTILAGCAEGEVYSGASIEVDLYPTSRYDAAYRADPPASGESIMSRCGGGS